jgi:hypothetical protein
MDVDKNPIQPKETAAMKLSRKAVQRKSRTLPQLRFEDQKLTSFAGLVVFQALFERLDLRTRLRRCFRHLNIQPAYDYAILMLGLVVHAGNRGRRCRVARPVSPSCLDRRKGAGDPALSDARAG